MSIYRQSSYGIYNYFIWPISMYTLHVTRDSMQKLVVDKPYNCTITRLGNRKVLDVAVNLSLATGSIITPGSRNNKQKCFYV